MQYVAPDKLPVEDFVVATEQACRSLPIDKADQLRARASIGGGRGGGGTRPPTFQGGGTA